MVSKCLNGFQGTEEFGLFSPVNGRGNSGHLMEDVGVQSLHRGDINWRHFSLCF